MTAVSDASAHANLLHRVAVANGDFIVGGGLFIADGLDVDGDAKRRADFVLPAVKPADGRRVVVHRMPTLAQIGAQLMRGLDDAMGSSSTAAEPRF